MFDVTGVGGDVPNEVSPNRGSSLVVGQKAPLRLAFQAREGGGGVCRGRGVSRVCCWLTRYRCVVII